MARKKITKVEVQFYTDEIAEAIRSVATASEAMTKSGLKQEAIVALLHDYTKVGKPAIRTVLEGLHGMKRFYLVPDNQKADQNG